MGWHTAGSEKSRNVLIRKYFAVVPRIHHRSLTGIGPLKKIEDAKCIRLISISTIDFGYGAKVPRPSRRVSRKKCRQVMAWVGTVQALLRETNFDAPYLVNALKSVGEPVNRSSASSGDRQVYYIGTTTFGIETPLNKRLRLRIRCFNTCILRLHLRSGRLNENSWNFYRTMSHFSESLLICYSRTMVIVSFHFNIDGNRVTVIIKL